MVLGVFKIVANLLFSSSLVFLLANVEIDQFERPGPTMTFPNTLHTVEQKAESLMKMIRNVKVGISYRERDNVRANQMLLKFKI